MNQRITAIDSLRGLIIIFMILGHTRAFFSPLSVDPIELALSSTGVYLTRVLTNFCAPLFFLLSGMSIFLLVRSYNNITLASRDLLIRGLILIALNFLYINITWTLGKYIVLFGVVWVLGLSMIMLGFLIRLPIKWMAIIGLIVILGHNLLDGRIDFSFAHNTYSFMMMLIHGGILNHTVNEYVNILFGYPIIPWFAMMLLGYVLAYYLLAPNVTPQMRQRILVYLGAGLLALFVLLRIVIGYGDMVDWSWQEDNIAYSFLSLFKITKYPPSLQYLCLTWGAGCLLLALFDRLSDAQFGKYLAVFGQAALFLYLIHVPLINAAAWLWHHFVLDGPIERSTQMILPLPLIYLIWLSFLPILYWACKWYRPIKMKYKNTILKYI